MFGAEFCHCFAGFGVGGRGGPGAGAAGENLEAVGSEFDGFVGGVEKGSGGGGVDADAAD